MPNTEIRIQEMMGKRKIRTIKELHLKSGISRTVISSLINENKNSIRLDTIVRLCTALDCEIGDLIVLKNKNE